MAFITDEAVKVLSKHNFDLVEKTIDKIIKMKRVESQEVIIDEELVSATLKNKKIIKNNTYGIGGGFNGEDK